MKVKDIQGIKMKQIYFEDVKAGDEITPLITIPFSQSQQAAYMASFGTWCPVFLSEQAAKDVQNFSTCPVQGVQFEVLLCKLITNWIGPNGTLKKLSGRERTPLYVGNRLIAKGEVVRKYVKEDENYVECVILAEKQDGTLIIEGEATVTLPSRNSGTA